MGRFELNIPPGIYSNDTALAEKGHWLDCNNTRFFYGEPRAIGGWESLTTSLLTGVCRNAFNWTDNAGTLNIGFGTHTALQVYLSGSLYDITPTLALAPATLSVNPFTVTAGSAVAGNTVMPGHGLTTGDSIVISGATNVGRQSLNGTFTVTVVDPNTFTFASLAGNAVLVKTLGATPFAQTSGTTLVTVTDTAHALATGSSITISGAVDTLTAGNVINGTFPITVTGVNTYTFNTAANSTQTGGNGGSAVVVTTPATGGGSAAVVTPQTAFATGNIDGSGQSGWGTGPFGKGGFSTPSDSDFYPRTWGLAAWGQNLLASPRGGGLYLWTNNTGTRAAALANAPTQVTYALVSPQDQVFALGCSQEASGVFNPLTLRHSSVRLATEWNTSPSTTAREYTLPGGGRIVGGRVLGAYLLIWTSHNLYLGTYVGQLTQVWRFDRVGDKCGLAGPNAAVVVGRQAYWLGKDLQFYSYTLGGSVTPLVCPISEDFKANLSLAQSDKVVASSNSGFDEIRFDYPDGRDGYENSRYVAVAIAGANLGAWYRGQMPRTAMVDAGPAAYPIGVTFGGNIYWHERGNTADGGAYSWFIESADQMISDDTSMLLRSCWPDLQEQTGAVSLTLTTRFKPRGPETVYGPYVIAPGQDKVDLRASGRLVRVKFSGSAGPTNFMLGKPIFDTTAMGTR